MSVYGLRGGFVRTQRGTLTDASTTAILDTANLANRSAVVIGLRLVNHSGGALTPTVDVYDGATARTLRDDVSIADQAGEDVSLPGGVYELIRGDSVRITANANLTWHISYIEPDPAVSGGTVTGGS